MRELQKKHHESRMERDKELYERQITIVDAQIDRLVYVLYGLTEKEIRVVEEEVSEVVMPFAQLLCASSLSRWKLETRSAELNA
ncbi:MAG: hypothetical protein WBE22_11125 [Halobacteriota archaeon]